MDAYWLDIGIAIAIVLSMITGLARGLVKEVIALVVWFAALWVAFHYYPVVEVLLKSTITDDTARKIVSFLALLIVSLIIGGLFNAILSFILKKTGLSGTDRLLGMGFGFVRGLFIVSLIMVVVKISFPAQQNYLNQSKLYPRFIPIVRWIEGYIPDMIKKIKGADKFELNGLVDMTSIIDEG